MRLLHRPKRCPSAASGGGDKCGPSDRRVDSHAEPARSRSVRPNSCHMPRHRHAGAGIRHTPEVPARCILMVRSWCELHHRRAGTSPGTPKERDATLLSRHPRALQCGRSVFHARAGGSGIALGEAVRNHLAARQFPPLSLAARSRRTQLQTPADSARPTRRDHAGEDVSGASAREPRRSRWNESLDGHRGKQSEYRRPSGQLPLRSAVPPRELAPPLSRQAGRKAAQTRLRAE